MSSNNFMVVWAVVAVVVVSYLARWARQSVAFFLARRQTGCYRVQKYPHIDPFFGYDLHRKRSRAQKDGNTYAFYAEQFDRFGKTWQEDTWGQCVINTMDPLNHQYIHATGFQDFCKPTSRMKGSELLLGNGIFAAEGEAWKHSRNRIKPIFNKAEVGNMTMMRKHVDRFLSLLPDTATAFDIQPMLKRLFLDLSTEFLFGESVDSQIPNNAMIGEKFLGALDASFQGWKERRKAGWFSFCYALDRTWPRALGCYYGFIDSFVHRALEATADQANGSLEKVAEVDHSDRHVLLYDLAQEIRCPIALRFEVVNVFLPSRDTNAVLLSNICFQLARHPRYWTQLREYAFNLPYDATDPSSLSFSTLKSLVPFRNVIQETLRTRGPVGRIFRMARQDTILPRGGGPDGTSPIFVPKGAFVCSHTYHIHHDKDIWGQDADDFRPERWNEATRKPWEFVPFSGGPRICPAQQQVIVQATYLLLRLVMAFEQIENKDEMYEFVELQKVTVESRRGVKIALKSKA